MNSPQKKLIGGMLIATAACLGVALSSHAQFRSSPAAPATTTTAASQPAATQPAATKPAVPAAEATMDPERAAIWNSPNMLRARAWLQEYCATSAKVKPGEAQQYLNELQNMSATQMKLWLLKFDEEEDRKQQQNAFWQQAHAAALGQAKTSDAATQKSYAAVETEENAAANQEQSQLSEEEQNEQAMQDTKQSGPYTPYGQGYYPGGGIHYHFHIYPY